MSHQVPIFMASPQTENGHIDIANELAEVLAKTQLNGYESRFLWVLWRKTYGWHKKEDWVSDSQIVEMTGLKKQHVWRTKQALLKRNIVTKNGYKISFQKDYTRWRELPKMVTVTKSGNKVTKSGIEVTKFGANKRNYTKETNTNVLGDKSPVRRDFRNPDIQEGIELLKQNQGHVVKENLNRYALQRLYKVYGKEKVLGVFKYACKIRGRQYAPQILNFMDLEQKWGNLEEYGKREKKELQTGYVDRPFRPEEHI